VDAGVVAEVCVVAAAVVVGLAALVVLLLLLPHPVATIIVAISAATPSHPLRACVVTSSSSVSVITGPVSRSHRGLGAPQLF
jgi:hypothetical protein